jgi:hypothetical protein
MLLVILSVLLLPLIDASGLASSSGQSYVLVGGQNGAWFQGGQMPRLYKIMLPAYSVTQLTPVSSEGTVWTGGWNGSQWLISGWGVDSGPAGSNPYLYLYDGQKQIVGGSLNQFASEASWHGGDVFAVSYNGRNWLLSGLGSSSLAEGSQPSNHMALGLFDGHNFTDLSSEVPNQWDAILYANSWNGHYWLVGGGWEGNDGELYRFDGTNFTDLSFQLESVIHQFHSVQAIQWNGEYWLVGGVGFLVKYDGRKFTDLTPELNAAISPRHVLKIGACCNAVNALAWNGNAWQIGGGAPISVIEPATAWVVNYDGAKFTDLTPLIPSYIANPSQTSSILTITYADGSWFYGGYVDGRSILLAYTNPTMADLSHLIGDEMSTVNWLGGWPKAANEGSMGLIRDFETYAAATIMVVAAALTIRQLRKRNRSKR